MEVEDQDLLDDEESDATDNDPISGAAGDSSADDNPVASDNAASNWNQSPYLILLLILC